MIMTGRIRMAVIRALAALAAIGSAGWWASGEGRNRGDASGAIASPARPASDGHTEVTGVVRDPQGRPVAGAAVAASFRNERGSTTRATDTTDAGGEFALSGPGTPFLLVAYAEGHAPALWDFLPLVGAPSTQGLELTLAEPEAFTGVVTDRDGEPIAGAVVRVCGMKGAGAGGREPIIMPDLLEEAVRGTPIEPLFRATTDERGRFRFPAAPPRRG